MLQDSLAQSRVSEGSDAARRVDLDWVRIAAFGLLIFYHVGMLYVSWDFHIKSEHRIPGLEPLMLVLSPWRLALLFLVSGVATAFMTDKLSPRRLLRSRALRLLPPLVFGMLVIVPPQSYEQVVEALGYDGGFINFYLGHYFAFGPQFCHPGPCLILPTWNHLWFVNYLWIYTLALGLVLLAAPHLVRRLEPALAPLFSGVMLLVIPAALFAVYRLALLPRFPSNHALVGDWYNHAVYGTTFLFGFLFAKAKGVWSAIARLRWPALSLAVAIFGSFLVLRGYQTPGVPASMAVKIYGATAYGSYQWFCIIAVLGFAQRWLNRDSAARRYLTDAVFPYYIVHQTAIILIAHQLKGLGLSAGLEAAIVIGGTAITCAATYEVVRRIQLLRPLFGLRWISSADPGRNRLSAGARQAGVLGAES